MPSSAFAFTILTTRKLSKLKNMKRRWWEKHRSKSCENIDFYTNFIQHSHGFKANLRVPIGWSVRPFAQAKWRTFLSILHNRTTMQCLLIAAQCMIHVWFCVVSTCSSGPNVSFTSFDKLRNTCRRMPLVARNWVCRTQTVRSCLVLHLG